MSRNVLERIARHTETINGPLRLNELQDAVNSWLPSTIDISSPCWTWTGSMNTKGSNSQIRVPTSTQSQSGTTTTTVPRVLFAHILQVRVLNPDWTVRRMCQNAQCILPEHSILVLKINGFGRPVTPLPAKAIIRPSIQEDEDFEDLVFMISSIGAQRLDPESLRIKPGWDDYSIPMIQLAQTRAIERRI